MALMGGDLVLAQEKYQQASELLTGDRARLAVLLSLQTFYDLGEFSSLIEKAPDLINGKGSIDMRRDALKLFILSLIHLGREERALSLLNEYGDVYQEPSWLMAMRDAQLLLGDEKEAERMGWLLRRDFPLSPEALILKGEAERAVKPTLLDPLLF